ncbi:MAG TPA: glycosyltransferase, partial [Thermoanaerobaculia bacterium]|nr:glycosyltransferase [Thermoanaerobaculia bacterium]
MAERLRVFHLIKGLGRGGAESLLLGCGGRHGEASVAYGAGYFLPWKDALVAPLREAGVEVVRFTARTAPGMLAQVPRIASFLRRWRAGVVHCHLPLAGVAGRLAGRLAGVPVVYTEHNLMERYHPWTRRANLWTWGLQARVVAVSAEVAASIERHGGSIVPVRVVRNGVPVDRLRRDAAAGLEVRRRLGIPEDAPVVGQVAVFRRQKRLDLWLETAREIRRRRPDARFLLVGDGPLRGKVESLARELGLGDAVCFAGLQDDVRPYLSAMDLLLVSS